MKKNIMTLLTLMLAMMFSISAFAENPAAVSHISSVADVPLITLNNGVQVPQLGLGTQIQSLERDSSEAGRALLNSTSHDAVVAALQAGYRHLDTAHGYFNERGVGQAIIDSGVPREEIWVTSKLWPSEYGEGKTMAGIDKMLKRLDTGYIDLLLLHQQFGDYIGAWKDMEKAVRQGKVRSIGLSNFESERLEEVLAIAEIKPAAMQVECHPYYQQDALKARLASYGTVIESWYPLGHADQGLMNEPVFASLAQKYGKSNAQIILRWHIQAGNMCSPRPPIRSTWLTTSISSILN